MVATFPIAPFTITSSPSRFLQNGWSRRSIVAIPIEEIKEIKVPKAPLMTKTPDDMLTEEKIQKLIGVCDNSKERALIACVFDAALRIEEAGYLRWRQIQKLKHGISISTDKKTGFPRYIPCATAWTYLKTWKMDYPALHGIPPEGDNFVFLTQKGEPYQYSGFQYLMKKFSRKLEKQGDKVLAEKLHFHLLRHTKLTFYAKQNMNESILCKIGWGKRSSMVERYVNLSSVDVEQAVMGISGSRIWKCRSRSLFLASARIVFARKCLRPPHIVRSAVLS